jgi:phage baseplate assembly protein W
MAVSKTISSNYVGRKKDISILQYPDASKPDAQLVALGFSKSGRFCAGVQKLVQRYTIILLTNIASQPLYPSFGTDLLYRLRQGLPPADRLLASQIFNTASFSAVRVLSEYQNRHTETPLDECIARATLTNISLASGSVRFEVTITTRAGDIVEFIVPLPK